jgi:WD40 repeat protein
MTMPRTVRWSFTLLLATMLSGTLASSPGSIRVPHRTLLATALRGVPEVAFPNTRSTTRKAGSERPRPTLVLNVGHSALVSCQAFSPDGRLLATGSYDQTVRLWDAHTRQLLAILQGHNGWVRTLAFSPDGRALATGSDDQQVRLWDVTSARLRATLRGHTGVVSAVAFSPDGRTLATASWGNTVRLWDRESGRLLGVLRGHKGKVNLLAFSPDGQTLATGSFDRTARLWEARTGRLRATLSGHTVVLAALAFSPDGRTLATAGGTRFENLKRLGAGEVRLWDAKSGQIQAVLRGHQNGVLALAFSPDGRTLATGSWDHTARLWDAITGQPRAVLSGHRGAIATLAFSPDGRTLATGGGEGLGPPGEARLWDVGSRRLRAVLSGHTNQVLQLAFSPNGQMLATAGADNSVRLWDPTSGQVQATLRAHPSQVLCSDLSPDRQTVATGSEDQLVRLWDIRTGRMTLVLPGHAAPVTALAFSPDGRTLATGSARYGASREDSSGEVKVWDARSGQLKMSLPGPMPAVLRLLFSPDGRTLAAGMYREARLWELATGRLQATLPHTTHVWELAFSPNGKLLATGGWSEARLWDVENGRLRATLEDGTRPFRDRIWSLAFSPDGRTVAAGEGWDRNVAQLWDVPGGERRTTLRGHTSDVFLVAFSPDGRTVATGAADRTARLWDTATGRLKATLSHPLAVWSLAFAPDGKQIATRDAGGRVRLWDPTGRPIPVGSQTRLAQFPEEFMRPWGGFGAAISLHDPRDGRVLATLLPLPEVAVEAAAARPIEIGARPIEVGARPVPGTGAGEWFVVTPEGYFDCSANAARFIQWNVNGILYPAERYLRRFRRPDLVRKALSGEPITAPQLSANDIPPAARFIGLNSGDAAPGDPLTVTVEARDDRDVKEVELLVNGRPLPPEYARPIDVGAKPIDLGAKPIDVGAKAGDPHHRLARRFTFRVPLPVGAPEVRLRAVAYNSTDLGSDPVEVVLRQTGVQPVVGNLFVLAVGVSRYRNAERQRFPHLRFPAVDAQAIGARFRREGRPLYERVDVRTLTDEQATAANVRAELQRLQRLVRPGQVDTVVLFLSGHGISREGHYFFATHDLDLKQIASSSLSGRELREALGGRLRARSVFLFADTCHSGGLAGRGDDLALEVGEGVYVMASSGAREYSYESASWGHGAFTLALLQSLDRRELAADGVVRFNALAYAVPDEVAALMKAAGRNEGEQEPCVPLAARRLRVPIVLAAR